MKPTTLRNYDGMLEFELTDFIESNLGDYVAKKISPYVFDGSMKMTSSTDRARYHFCSGTFDKTQAIRLEPYYKGEEMEAVKNLPPELIKAVLQTYGQANQNINYTLLKNAKLRMQRTRIQMGKTSRLLEKS